LDGYKLVFVEAYHLATYDLVTYQKRTLTPDFGSYEFCPRVPVWLTGDVIAFIRKDEATDEYLIWTIPAGGGTITKYAVVVDADSSLGGDESGRYVYYTEDETRYIGRLDLLTGEARQITHEHFMGYGQYDAVAKPSSTNLYFIQRYVPFSYTVSGDGKYLVYPHRDGLFSLEVNTGAETWLTRAPETWADKDRRPCFSPDNRYIVFARSGNIYRCDAP